MKIANVLGAVLVVAITCVACQSASGQYPARYAPPAGPVLPNALNYFRRDVGVLDPYNTFVQPRRQLNQQLGAMAAQERADNRRLQQEIGQIRQSLAAPTGVGAGFQNHRQYFNIPQGRQVGRSGR